MTFRSLFQRFQNMLADRRRRARKASWGAPITLLAADIFVLEPRVMLAADVISFTRGTLMIDSDATSVQVGSNAAGKVTINGDALSVNAKDVRYVDLLADNVDGVFVDFTGITPKAFKTLRGTEVTTGAGNDSFVGSFTADNFFAGAGDDVFKAGNGFRDCFNGGTGTDKVEAKLDGGIFLALDCLFISTNPFNVSFMRGVEQIAIDASSARHGVTVNTTHFSGDVTVIGSTKVDRINTGKGNDAIDGNGGADNISSGAGDDFVSSFGGSVLGGAGNDFIDASQATVGVKIDGGTGDDFIVGSKFNDMITGSGKTGNDTVFAGNGNDTIDYSRSTVGFLTGNGENGNDTLRGGKGDDFLSGGEGDDNLYGGAGDDSLFGDNGRDFYDGGTGVNFISDPDNENWDLARKKSKRI